MVAAVGAMACGPAAAAATEAALRCCFTSSSSLSSNPTSSSSSSLNSSSPSSPLNPSAVLVNSRALSLPDDNDDAVDVRAAGAETEELKDSPGAEDSSRGVEAADEDRGEEVEEVDSFAKESAG